MKKLNIVFRIAALSCFSLAVIPSLVSAASLYRQLELGSRGSDVSDLQTFLAQDRTIYPQGLVTGYFGSLTKSAVSNFQSRNGISTVGRVGPQTMAVINSQMGGGSTVIGNDMSAPAFTSANVTMAGSMATFVLTTNVATRATVFYSNSPLAASENLNVTPITVSVSGTGVRADTDLRTSHSINSMSLNPNTTYYFMMVVTDANGTVSVHSRMFTTGSF